MANRFVKIGGSNLLDGTTTGNAWETAIYGFTNVGASNTLKFLTGTYDIDRSSTHTPVPNGASGNHTIVTDNADGVVTFNHPGTGSAGLLYFTARSPLPNYITFEATSQGNIVFDMEGQVAFGAGMYFGNNDPATSHDITLKNLKVIGTANSSIFGGQTGNLTIDGCILGEQVAGASSGGGYGVYASGPNLTIINCDIHDTRQAGIHCYPGNRAGRVFANNLIYNTGLSGSSESGDGITITEGSGTIYNNVIHTTPNGVGIFAQRTTSLTIYHNSLYSGGSAHSQPGIDINNGSGTATGTIVKNNIVIGYSGGTIAVRSAAVNTTVQWNICDGAITNASGSTTASNNTTTAVSTDEWVDPTNATLASRDFNLKAGADSIYNATTNAVPSVGIATDIEGTSRNFIDQGAYAYGSTTPPDPPIISHPGSEIVTHEFTNVSLTLTKGTNNIVTCAVSGTGASAISATPTNVTVVRN